VAVMAILPAPAVTHGGNRLFVHGRARPWI